jgi:ABC-2 type transport system permease protein
MSAVSDLGGGFSWRRCIALSGKEIRQIARDPSTFLIAFVLPLLLLFLFGYAINLDNARTNIGVALLDDSPAAQSLADTYANSPYFEVLPARDVAPLEAAMVADRIRAIVVIPQDFSAGVARGTPPAVQIITDGSQPNQASLTAAYAEGVRRSWMAGRAADVGLNAAPPVSVNTRTWFNPALTSRWFLIPGAIAIVMTLIGTLLTSLVIAREWERGTMEAMMATPMRMSEFLASKILPYFVLALASMGLCTVLAVTEFGLPMHGSIGALLLISAAYLLPALGQGLLISAATKNQFLASQLALITGFLPTFLLSGFLYEISSMPLPIQLLTYIIPARYLIPSLQTVFLAGDVWPLILPNVGILVLFGAFYFYRCFRVTRRSLD